MKGIVLGFADADRLAEVATVQRDFPLSLAACSVSSRKAGYANLPVAVVSLDAANIVSRVEVAAQQMYEGFNDKSATSWDAASDACRAYYRRGALLAVRAALEIGEAQHG